MSEAGVVTVGVAPVRREPDHASEQVTQACMGEGFLVLEEDASGEWWRVRLDEDGYAGWLRAWYGQRRGAAERSEWAERAVARIRTGFEVLRAAPRRGAEPLAMLPWQSRVELLERNGAWGRVRLADGREGHLPSSSVVTDHPPGGPGTPARLVRTARSWLGSAYLWGGRTPAGFDCSGLVQSVWGWHGVRLPRDAAQQRDFAVSLGRPRRRAVGSPGSEAKAGDLLFFGPSPASVTHVAIGAGNSDFVHAYGAVCLGSLNEMSEHYTPQLLTRFIGAWTMRG